jgi:hypothetical protein
MSLAPFARVGEMGGANLGYLALIGTAGRRRRPQRIAVSWPGRF